LVLATLFVVAPWVDRLALAEPPSDAQTDVDDPLDLTKKPDLALRLPGDPDTWIRPTYRTDYAIFFERNAWAGNSKTILGDHVDHWGEVGIVPGLEGQLSLGEPGKLRARVSGVYTDTMFGLDAAGSNCHPGSKCHPNKFTLEDAYVGWSSGKLIPALGEDAIDLSVGSQPYQVGTGVGTGFLFYDGGTDGGKRGGYWLGMRRAFRFTGIARLKTGPLLAEGMFLRPYDDPNTSTKVAGMNLEYSFGDRGRLGGGYWNVLNSNDKRRDGLNVYDLRGEVHPLESLLGLGFSGDIVRERNGRENNSWGGFASVFYDFKESVRFSPYVEYRYAAFQGDDGTGNNRSFDPLFYGFSDWNQWYLGEIVGEYVATNRNLSVNLIHLRANPISPVTLHFFYLHFHLNEFSNELTSRPPSNPRASQIENKKLADELDFIVDWSATDYLSFSGVAAFLVPSSGAKDFFGASGTWSDFMLYTSLKF
jgi:hypothetical protein